MRSDDLVPVLADKPPAGVGFRQGVVLSWDQNTAANQISVGGSVLTNVPVLNTSEAVSLAPGAVVGLLTSGPSWFILGRITIPGTPEAATALAIGRTKGDTVTTTQPTTSSTFTDLATVGPTVPDVLIGPSGIAVVIMTALIHEASADSARGGTMSYAVSGATTLPADNARRLRIGNSDDGVISGGFSSNNLYCRASAVHLHEGLNPGLTTFTAKYLSNNGDTANFSDRTLIVMPL